MLLNPVLEITFFSPVLIKTHQCVELSIHHRPAESAARETAHDLARADGFLIVIRGAANKDAVAAGCVARAGSVERTRDDDAVHAARSGEDRPDSEVGIRLVDAG